MYRWLYIRNILIDARGRCNDPLTVVNETATGVVALTIKIEPFISPRYRNFVKHLPPTVTETRNGKSPAATVPVAGFSIRSCGSFASKIPFYCTE